MIDETDLMLGDWIYLTVHKTNARVTELRSTDPDVVLVTDKGEVEMRIDMKPIPLTGEILEKNGFEKQSESPIAASYRLCLDEDTFSYLFVDFRLRTGLVHVCFDPEMKCPKIGFSKYEMSVHELQHAMRMCGIEKEIEL